MKKRFFFKKNSLLARRSKSNSGMGVCTENVFSDNCWRESSFSSFISFSHLRNDYKNVHFKTSKDLDILDNDSNLILRKKKS